jgi:hypothetical protein
MKEHLTIRNFGPIREADIQPRDLTIFVGPQASGKSLAAQALCFLRGIEDPLSSVMPSTAMSLESVRRAFKWWFGNDDTAYAGPGTLLRWTNVETVSETVQEIRWEEQGARLSEALEKRVQEAGPGREPRWWKRESYYPQVYIPTGRPLYSFFPPSVTVRILSSSPAFEHWPGYILTFYQVLGTAIQQLGQIQGQDDLSSKRDELAFVQSRIESIFKGKIRYNAETVALETHQKTLYPTTIAAGQVEIWPFWAIVEANLRLGQRFDFDQVYYEEPEAHLHPGAQRDVMETVAFLVRRGLRFLITTHSPYILYAVNNFLMAQQVLAAGRTLPAGVPPETALRPDQVAAYRFAVDGTVHDIMDAETGLIDEDELDQVADDLGATFTRLQEQLEGAE